MPEPRQSASPADSELLALAGETRVVIGKLMRRLREQSSTGDFTPSQIGVLIRLERDGPATLTALAKSESVRTQSMGATVAVLQAAGLISGEPDPSDGRQTILSITDACRGRIHAGRAAKEDWLFQIIHARLDPAEQQQLAAGLELLKRIAD